eukprot:CAMPEP_0113636610 /NCGR_PEP_ID=MMETSP0017_2-20120614/19116_1 /TAXON_ID=2856 /ORGANISM="Cylindrotheca closterium" /LENGTH=127 /DNA_ID=CAMNT_0000547505 /DNA_START=158 /DNA_END=539 /DNA_ORIENTATION=- /assembly_acc=CAM_ASM_000147
MTFKNEEDQKQALEEWRPVTKYCGEKEPFLFHYEVGRNDADPLKIHMVERYKSKEDYINKHKKGEEFLKFRPKLKALADAGKVKIEGFSYQELGYGFVKHDFWGNELGTMHDGNFFHYEVGRNDADP